jgi:signal transduction histidine kinase
MRAGGESHWTYWVTVLGAGLFALIASWTPLAVQIDKYGSDWLFRLHKPKPWTPETAILAIDEDSYTAMRGTRHLRARLADVLTIVSAAKPVLIAIDVVLADEGNESQDDQRLASVLRQAGNIVLPVELLPGSRWAKPLPAFQAAAAGLGHVHADPDPQDGMSRCMPLVKTGARERYWALSLEAFRLARHSSVVESPDALSVQGRHIPATLRDERLLRIRYLPPEDNGDSRIPHISLKEVWEHPERAVILRNKVVFVGATAQTATRDRMLTPYNTVRFMPGVEIHAHAFETLAQGKYISDASPSIVLLLALLHIAAAAAIFNRWTGRRAYFAGAAVVLLAYAEPHFFFQAGVIYPFVAPIATASLAVTCAAAIQYFRTRTALAVTESERSRYREAIQFVTHEMRTPLSAIQGSSELMNRYTLTEEKQKQLSRQIHSESKRLARMIQTFLDVERLSAGQMELKQVPFEVADVVGVCLDRVRPLAERKSIQVVCGEMPEAVVQGDRELMEYAIYNLLTNAIKYSPAETRVEVRGSMKPGQAAISIEDQGIGMTAEELKRLGQKFFRTKRAEQTGEPGTGIGLSIVQQIVDHHGGVLRVTSSPGHGSCFTMLIPASFSPVSAAPQPEK